MGRVAWSQLRFRTVRLIALLLGMLLATTAFTVLTAASRTSQLRTIGTVSQHFVPAYDILVRPRNSRTSLETRTDTVQPNFLSGLYGGITMAQYRQIAAIPGVDVAAPVAMIGYTLLDANLSWSLPGADFDRSGRQLYRNSSTWISAAGTSKVTAPAWYTYLTPRPLRLAAHSGTDEILPGGRSVLACPLAGGNQAASHPFGIAGQAAGVCWSKVNKDGLGRCACVVPANPGWGTGWVIPVLMAAIDPAAEARLDGLNRALISGKYLAENATGEPAAGGGTLFPVLAASSSGIDEQAVSQLQVLPSPAAPPDLTVAWMAKEAAVAGRTVAVKRTTAQQAYRQMLQNLAARNSFGALTSVNSYWTVGSVSYQRDGDGVLTPRLVHNPVSVWNSGQDFGTPIDNSDNQYRALALHAVSGPPAGPSADPRLVGIFNPADVQSFDPLSQVPLGVYQPTVAAPANAASRSALHGADLLPSQNLGGYVGQPVDLITTLSALPALQNSGFYGRNLDAADPISVIRVRVAGVTGPNSVSLARIRQVAQQIDQDTHLDVDIVAGSSPSPTTIDLPAGKYGQPALTLSEDWVKKGVAVAILTAVDKDSVVLFALILIVCVLFVANSASAAIRGRRRELGVLAALGWTRPRLFTAVLGELAAIGLTAGILGALAALPLASALRLHASPGRAALAVPIAMAVAVIAGLIPAWLAARADPVESVRPPVMGVRRGHQPGGITGLAAVNVLRTPGRAIVGAISLAVGITALTLVTAMTFAFRGVVVGSLLGDAVAVQVRGVDYLAVTATVALGVLAVADVVFLNISDRAAELSAIRSFGWRESALSRLVITEGAIIGLAGSIAGATIGLAAAADFAGRLPARLFIIAAAAIIAGVLVTATAALLPAQALRRLPAAHHLAEE
jgi:putative ABC transport system permease protein